MAISKKNLIDSIAAFYGDLTKKTVASIVDATFEQIATSLSTGESVQIVGFGSFDVRERAARIGRNPQTGEAIQIAASKYVGFKAGKAIKDAVNGK